MFSVKEGNPELLRSLDISPVKLFPYLVKWQKCFSLKVRDDLQNQIVHYPIGTATI